MSTILVGHDGEFFLHNGDRIVPSQGLIPGTKEDPHPLNLCMIHRDNVMGEFGTPPSAIKKGFIGSVTGGIGEIRQKLETMGLSMVFKPHHIFEPDDLTHPEARSFGCEPDFDCYIGGIGKPPSVKRAGCMRSAGGHVHGGFEFEDFADQMRAALACELTLGLFSVLHDDDVVRRKLYGQSGRCRPKPYGIEARITSNFWYNSEELMGQVFDRMKTAIIFRDELSSALLSSERVREVRNAINTSNKKVAEELIKHFCVEERVNEIAA